MRGFSLRAESVSNRDDLDNPDRGLDAASVSDSRHVASADLSVELAGIPMRNPLMTASGTCGYGPELSPFIDINTLGAFVTKSITLRERRGNPPPRTVETASGMLNAIGLANVGLDRFCTEKLPFLRDLSIPVIANVAGHTTEDYVAVCERLDAESCVAAIELNVSCPNVADGLEFGTDPGRLEQLTAAVRAAVRRAKLIVKLTPNASDVASLARAAIDGGADILSLINTLRGMAIHAETRKPLLANVTGGLSGPAIKPVALAMVHQVYTRVARDLNVPLVAMGGVRTWQDAVEFHIAGATGVAIGTALFADPRTPVQVCEGLSEYLQRTGIGSIRNLIGSLVLPDNRR